MKITKTQILNELKLTKVWNSVRKIYGVNIATVMWDNKPWKVVHSKMTHDQITATVEIERTDSIFKGLTYNKRTYTPIAEFKYQTELANYIKEVINK